MSLAQKSHPQGSGSVKLAQELGSGLYLLPLTLLIIMDSAARITLRDNWWKMDVIVFVIHWDFWTNAAKESGC